MDVQVGEDPQPLVTLKGFFFRDFWPRLPVGASATTTSTDCVLI